MASNSASRIGFLLCCFLLPGLIGTFASFAIPAPVVDEQHQQAALDAVLNAPDATTRQTAIATLADAVDPDTAALVTKGTDPLPARIAAAEQNMRREVVAQARAEAYRIRLMVITLTILGAGFGVALLGRGSQAAR
ncbi:MAG: hypothetical protein B7Z81_12670 [Acidocella sp. 20-61-6]|nr:MAG: hypothetical protein B7Z81_12670 [Acidocella sp. 20-61-6]